MHRTGLDDPEADHSRCVQRTITHQPQLPSGLTSLMCTTNSKDSKGDGKTFIINGDSNTRKQRFVSPAPKISKTFFTDCSFTLPKVKNVEKKKVYHNLVHLISDSELEQMKKKIWSDYYKQLSEVAARY